jgi:hypothetical protein
MYALSRSLYRELVVMLASSGGSTDGCADRRYLLDRCEHSMRRLVLDPDGCAHPARSLFAEIRHLVPLGAQPAAWEVVSVHVKTGRNLGASLEASLKRDCRALTRQGSPCRREPQPGDHYCPSHRHLEELTEVTVLHDDGRAPAEIAAG